MFKSFIPLCFIFFWIVPVAWVGLTRSNFPLYPKWIAPLFRVTGVFESAPEEWQIFFIETQTSGSDNWALVDEKSLFAATPLGNRTRFQQAMDTLKASKNATGIIQLLNWIVDHLAESHESSSVKAVRIVHFGIPYKLFLKAKSMDEVYRNAKTANLPIVVDASLNVRPAPYENH